MKITRFETFLANAGLRNYLFVRLTADNGLTGVGEATLEWQERTVEVNPGGTGWVKEDSTKCKTVNGQPVGEVFCLVKHPPEVRTLRTQVMVKPATTREVCLPAEYEMRRFQKLVNPATTRKISIPAEYEEVTKTVQVAGGKLEWQRGLPFAQWLGYKHAVYDLPDGRVRQELPEAVDR